MSRGILTYADRSEKPDNSKKKDVKGFLHGNEPGLGSG